jgi:hypothetical protein
MLVRFAPSLIALVLLAGMLSAASERSAPSPTSWRCLAPPIEPCFIHRGRLSAQNGIAYMIWLVGTKRIVAVSDTEIPAMLGRYLDMTSPDHSDIYGDFEICPLGPDQPGHMRSACVTSAVKLVVQDRDRSRPGFRLLSTWPKTENK